ncbi:MAG: tRNA (adenosine(37)-N6)-dimethylallyltransferase MiaA [Candidatus Zixiibacteriota bacterium]
MERSGSKHHRVPPLPFLAIVGATGTGKNALAQEIATQSDATLISVDSRKIYRGMDIGTAKPSPEVQRRFEYAMIDRVDPDEAYSAGRYARETNKVIAERRKTGHPIILVGGTGFYLDALIHGLPDLPEVDRAVRTAILAEAATTGWDSLYGELRRVDPEFASRILPSDKTRILRGCEFYRQTGRPLSRHLEESARLGLDEPIVVVWIDRPRPELLGRIEQRVHAMMRQGLVDEVASLLRKGFGPDSPGMATVGYQETIAHLQGQLSLEEATQLIIRNTGRYAKRQVTWFRHRPYALPVKYQGAVAQHVMDAWRGSEPALSGRG